MFIYKIYPTLRETFVDILYTKLAAIDFLILYTKWMQKLVKMYTFFIHQFYTSCTIFVYKMYRQFLCSTPHNFCLAFIDELEKQRFIKKTVEVGQ